MSATISIPGTAFADDGAYGIIVVPFAQGSPAMLAGAGKAFLLAVGNFEP